jgi:protein gp37
MRMAARLEAMGQAKYADLTRKSGGRYVWRGKVRLDQGSLNIPTTWAKPRRVFVNSMSDLFHEGVPERFIHSVFDVMASTPRHTYQILTKRADRLLQVSPSLSWPSNVWMGVSVESDDFLRRIDLLRMTGARIKFLSLEPLLGPLPVLDLSEIDWVIAGGESGPSARSMSPDWIRDIRDQCTDANVAFHFKQWGGRIKSRNGRVLDGRTWDDSPDVV